MSDGLDHLWAGWRSGYIDSVVEPDTAGSPADGDGTLFERILRLDDERGFVVRRQERCSVLLNAYPYTNGHALVLPNLAAAALGELDDPTHDELWRLVRETVTAIERAYRCDGVNVGMNLGKAAGAGVPGHLHVHVLPRWNGDTNFMTAVSETRVMPETLGTSWRKLRDAWPV